MRVLFASSAENGILYSTDLGKTWKILSLENANNIIFNIDDEGTAILASDDGIKVSTDGGFTWEEVDTSGAFGNFIQTDDDTIYVSSYDDNGIYKSDDNGETWTQTEITDGSYKESYDNIFVGDNGAVEAGTMKLISTIPMKSTGYSIAPKNKSIEIYDTLQEKELNSLIEYVINVYLKPSLSLQATGRRNFLEGTRYTSTTEDSKGYKMAFASDSVYNIKSMSSLIDWEEDLGMQPFSGLTIADLVDMDLVEDSVVYGTIKGERSDKIIDMTNRIALYITALKNEWISNLDEELENYSDTGVGEIKEVSTETDLAVNLEAYDLYMSTEKERAKIIAESLGESLFKYDEYILEMILKAGLFETIQLLAPHIKSVLLELGRKAHRTGEVQEYSPFDDEKNTFNLPKGIEIAVRKYLEKTSTNLVMLNEDSDKSLIQQAALYYKSEEKDNLIKSAYTILSNITAQPFDDNFGNYSKYDTDITNFCESIISMYNDGKTYEEALEEYESTEFEYKNLDFEKLLEHTFFEIYFSFAKKLETGIEFSYFDTDSDKAQIKQLTASEINRLYKYLKEIHLKFLERCKNLLNYCYTNIEDEDSLIKQKDSYFKSQEMSIVNWIKTLYNGNIIEKKRCMISNNYPLASIVSKEYTNKLVSDLKTTFKNKENII